MIGYGTTTVKSNTGSISSVKADDIMNYPSANFANSLAGKATGIQVIQSQEPLVVLPKQSAGYRYIDCREQPFNCC